MSRSGQKSPLSMLTELIESERASKASEEKKPATVTIPRVVTNSNTIPNLAVKRSSDELKEEPQINEVISASKIARLEKPAVSIVEIPKLYSNESENAQAKQRVEKYVGYIDFSLTDYSLFEDSTPLSGHPIDDILNEDLSLPYRKDLPLITLPVDRLARQIRNFPTKLYTVLSLGAKVSHAVCWMHHGRSFKVVCQKTLLHDIFPRFSKPIKWPSFTRQLQLWGFKRINFGPDVGSYYHQLFLRGHPKLVRRINCLSRDEFDHHSNAIKLIRDPKGEPRFNELAQRRPLPPAENEDLCLPKTYGEFQRNRFQLRVDGNASKLIQKAPLPLVVNGSQQEAGYLEGRSQDETHYHSYPSVNQVANQVVHTIYKKPNLLTSNVSSCVQNHPVPHHRHTSATYPQATQAPQAQYRAQNMYHTHKPVSTTTYVQYQPAPACSSSQSQSQHQDPVKQAYAEGIAKGIELQQQQSNQKPHQVPAPVPNLHSVDQVPRRVSVHVKSHPPTDYAAQQPTVAHNKEVRVYSSGTNEHCSHRVNIQHPIRAGVPPRVHHEAVVPGQVYRPHVNGPTTRSGNEPSLPITVPSSSNTAPQVAVRTENLKLPAHLIRGGSYTPSTANAYLSNQKDAPAPLPLVAQRPTYAQTANAYSHHTRPVVHPGRPGPTYHTHQSVQSNIQTTTPHYSRAPLPHSTSARIVHYS